MHLIFDTETSDLPNFKLPADDPAQARIVQLGAMLCDGDDFAPVAELNTIIKPDGWTIAEGAQKVHGISLERAMDEGRPIADVIEEFDALFDRTDVLVGFNIRFDNKLVRGARRRLERPDRFGERPEVDVMRLCTRICNIPPTAAMMRAGINYAKSPKLEEAFRIMLEREMPDAHDAMGDVRATRDLLVDLHRRGIDISGKMPKSGRVQ